MNILAIHPSALTQRSSRLLQLWLFPRPLHLGNQIERQRDLGENQEGLALMFIDISFTAISTNPARCWKFLFPGLGRQGHRTHSSSTDSLVDVLGCQDSETLSTPNHLP